MSRRVAIAAAAVVAAILALAIWLFNTGSSGPRTESRALVPDDAAGPTAGRVEIGPAGLAIPVAGIRLSDLVDSYSQARSDGEHDALDILAPAGTPVVAVAPSRVEKLYFSQGADGITAYVRSDDGRWIYYYAHLQGYAPGLKEGQRVGRGQMIGRVGSTGSASPRGPHLHFEIRRMSEEEPWSRGKAVNPYPFLTGHGT